jgi:hypothetical protein
MVVRAVASDSGQGSESDPLIVKDEGGESGRLQGDDVDDDDDDDDEFYSLDEKQSDDKSEIGLVQDVDAPRRKRAGWTIVYTNKVLLLRAPRANPF